MNAGDRWFAVMAFLTLIFILLILEYDVRDQLQQVREVLSDLERATRLK
jgi:hypothetical protein